MKYVGMFINLTAEDLDKYEVKDRIDAFIGALKAKHTGPLTVLEPVYGAGRYVSYPGQISRLIARIPATANLEMDVILFAPCGPSVWNMQLQTQNKVLLVCAGVIDPYTTNVLTKNYRATGYYSYDLVDLPMQMADILLKHGVENIGVIWDPQMRAGIGQMGVILVKFAGKNVVKISIRDSDDDIKTAVDQLAGMPSPAILVLNSTLTATRRAKIISTVNANNLLSIYPNCLYVRPEGGGGLMSCGPQTIELYKLAGGVAGAVLNGSPIPPLKRSPLPYVTCCNSQTAEQFKFDLPSDLNANIV
jgi:hypothetical protein